MVKVRTGGALILTRLTSKRLGQVAGISQQCARKILQLPQQKARTTTTTTTTKRKRAPKTPKDPPALEEEWQRMQAGRLAEAELTKAWMADFHQNRDFYLRDCKLRTIPSTEDIMAALRSRQDPDQAVAEGSNTPVPTATPPTIRVSAREGCCGSRRVLDQAVAERRAKVSRSDGNKWNKGNRILPSLQQLEGRLGWRASRTSINSRQDTTYTAPPRPTPNVLARRSTPRTRLNRAGSELGISRRGGATGVMTRSQTRLSASTPDLTLVPIKCHSPLAHPQCDPGAGPSVPQGPGALQARRRTARRPSHVRRCSQCRTRMRQRREEPVLKELEEEEEGENWLTSSGRMSIYCSREPCIVQ